MPIEYYFEDIPQPQPKAKCKDPLKVLIDTREQKPYLFIEPEKAGEVEIYVGTIATGDYAVVGLSGECSVERKELSDFIACCGRERDRFKRELARLSKMAAAAVIVEADYKTIAAGRYRSQISTASVLGSIASWTVAYRVPILLCGNRENAECMTLKLLHQFKRHLMPED